MDSDFCNMVSVSVSYALHVSSMEMVTSPDPLSGDNTAHSPSNSVRSLGTVLLNRIEPVFLPPPLPSLGAVLSHVPVDFEAVLQTLELGHFQGQHQPYHGDDTWNWKTKRGFDTHVFGDCFQHGGDGATSLCHDEWTLGARIVGEEHEEDRLQVVLGGMGQEMVPRMDMDKWEEGVEQVEEDALGELNW